MAGSDFNGDGRDDLLWRHDSGAIGYWYGEASGGFTVNPILYSVPLDWLTAGTGDFNGDGRDDILWRHQDGRVGYWYGQADGSFTVNVKITGVAGAWKIAGTGDVNGDGRDDIVWRHEDGRVGTWLGQADGGFTPGVEIAVPLNWLLSGVGDFDGDGRDDLLWLGGGANWMGTWSGTANGSFIINSQLTYNRQGAWFIADYDGDGRDDAVLVDDWSWYNVIYARPGGGFGGDEYEPFGDAASSSTMRAVGDYDGDGVADPIFRNTDGTVTVGGWEVTYSNQVPNEWHIANDPLDWFPW
ncbi:MAG TPA: VCBS repeat-containing protein [Sphingomicrobium sp.]